MSGPVVYNWDIAPTGGYQAGDGKWSEAKWCADNNTEKGTELCNWQDGNIAYFRNMEKKSDIVVDQDVNADTIKIGWTPEKFSVYGPLPAGSTLLQSSHVVTTKTLEIGNAEGCFRLDCTYQYGLNTWDASGDARLNVTTDLVVSRFTAGKLHISDKASVSVGQDLNISSPGVGDFRTAGALEMEGGTLSVGRDLYVGWRKGIDTHRLGSRPEGFYTQSGGDVTVGGSLVVAPSDLGGYNAGGGQTLGKIGMTVSGGQLTISKLLVVSSASSTFTPIIPRLTVSGGAVLIKGGATINNYNGTDKTRICEAQLHVAGGSFKTCQSMTLVSNNPPIPLKASVRVTGGVLDVDGIIYNKGGEASVKVFGPGKLETGGIQVEAGALKIEVYSGATVSPVPRPVVVNAGSLFIKGAKNMVLQFNGGMVLKGDTTISADLKVAKDITGTGNLVISGSTVDLCGHSISGLQSLTLSGTILNAASISVGSLVIAGAARIIAGPPGTIINGAMSRHAGSTVAFVGSVQAKNLPPSTNGMLPPWVLVEGDFATADDEGGMTKFEGYSDSMDSADAVAQVQGAVQALALSKAFSLKLLPKCALVGASIDVGHADQPVAAIILKGNSALRAPMNFMARDDVIVYVEDSEAEMSGLVTSGNAGVTKAGAGGLVLLGDLTKLKGPITLNSGALHIRNGRCIAGKALVIPHGSDGALNVCGQTVRLGVTTLGNAPRSVIENTHPTPGSIECCIMEDTEYTGDVRDNGGPLTFIKTGKGLLSLKGDVTCSGGIVVKEGTLKVYGTPPDVPLAIEGGAKIIFVSAVTITNPLTVGPGGGIIEGTVVLAGPISGTGELRTRKGEVLLKSAGAQVGGLTVGFDQVGGTFTASAGSSLTVNNPTSVLQVAHLTKSIRYEACLDLTALSSFKCDVAEINVGLGAYQIEAVGSIKFPPSCDLTARKSLYLAAYGIDNAYWPAPSKLFFGSGQSAIHCPDIRIGTSQGIGEIHVASGGTLTIDNGPGVRTDLTVGQGLYDSNRYTLGGIDGKDATLNILADTLMIAQGEVSKKQFPIIFGTVTLYKGLIDATTIIMGKCGDVSRGRGKLYIHGGEVVVGDGGITFASSTVSSGFSVLGIYGGGKLRLAGGPGGDLIIGPLESLAKGDHELHIKDKAVFDMGGHGIRFIDDKKKYLGIQFEGGFLRNPGVINMDFRYKYGQIQVAEFDATFTGKLNPYKKASIIISAGRKLTCSTLIGDDSATITLEGVLEVTGSEKTMKFEGPIGGAGKLVLNSKGKGQLSLSGKDKAIRGGVEVREGILDVDIALTANTVVQEGGVLTGQKGAIRGWGTIDKGGRLVASSVAPFTLDALRLNAGSIVDVTVTNPGAPAAVVVRNKDTCNIMGGMTIEVKGNAAAPGVYPLISFVGGLKGNVSDIVLNNAQGKLVASGQSIDLHVG